MRQVTPTGAVYRLLGQLLQYLGTNVWDIQYCLAVAAQLMQVMYPLRLGEGQDECRKVVIFET